MGGYCIFRFSRGGWIPHTKKTIPTPIWKDGFLAMDQNLGGGFPAMVVYGQEYGIVRKITTPIGECSILY